MASIQTQYAIALSILLTTIFFFKVNSHSNETTSFSIPKFSSSQKNLIIEGDAYTRGEKLILNDAVRNSDGVALYSAPIHIWDSKTENLANFTTSFTFVRNAPYRYGVADYMSFFIASLEDSKPRRGGGYHNDLRGHGNILAHSVVVEFEEDKYIHIYINRKRIASESCNLQNGKPASVEISFNAATDKLTVRLTQSNSKESLSAFLPSEFSHEWVTIGLFGSSGIKVARHEILSWSFKSELNVTSNSKQVADA